MTPSLNATHFGGSWELFAPQRTKAEQKQCDQFFKRAVLVGVLISLPTLVYILKKIYEIEFHQETMDEEARGHHL